MATIGFCGLGQMGAPMAARLLDGGHQLVVWNRTAERAQPLVERGATAAATPAELARQVEAVVTMLADPGAIGEVVFGDDGMAPHLGGRTLVEMSTIGPGAVHDLGRRLPPDADLLDAPVLGSIKPASEGTLQVFVGGDTALFERWRAVLECFGTPRHFGPLGSGAAMKLVANSCLGALMTTLGEALALADALGLEQDAVLDVLENSPIGVTAKSKRERIESGRFEPNFRLALAVKDMHLVLETAAAEGVTLEVGPAALRWLEQTLQDDNLADLDYSAVTAVIRRKPAGP